MALIADRPGGLSALLVRLAIIFTPAMHQRVRRPRQLAIFVITLERTAGFATRCPTACCSSYIASSSTSTSAWWLRRSTACWTTSGRGSSPPSPAFATTTASAYTASSTLLPHRPLPRTTLPHQPTPRACWHAGLP